MKALSVKQAWANLIAAGEKTIETRTWASNRGNEVYSLSFQCSALERPPDRLYLSR